MKSTLHWFVALAGMAVLAASSFAQITSSAVVAGAAGQQVYTTGLFGLTTNQTARLNVLNLSPTISPTASTAANNCTVQLQFVDTANTSLKEFVQPNFTPQNGVSLDLKRTDVTGATTPRTEVRGVIIVNPNPAPAGAPSNPGYCAVFPTLEVFDQTTGSTITFSSDTRAVLTGLIVPLVLR